MYHPLHSCKLVYIDAGGDDNLMIDVIHGLIIPKLVIIIPVIVQNAVSCPSICTEDSNKSIERQNSEV